MEPTDAETKLWSMLRNRRLGGMKFRRQRPVGRYFLDFYCVERRLAVEADGGQHFTELGRAHDERRTQDLQSMGMRVLRFTDREILLEPEWVEEQILSAITAPSP